MVAENDPGYQRNRLLDAIKGKNYLRPKVETEKLVWIARIFIALSIV